MKGQFIAILAILFFIIVLPGSVSAVGLADSAWPIFNHDVKNRGKFQYQGPQTNEN